MSTYRRGPLAERFWMDVVRGDDCWLWTGPVSRKSGYGHIGSGGRVYYAHRVSWELANGPIPVGFCVLHRCDVRVCVRPDHLFIGTKGDNNRDTVAKGRNRVVLPGLFGEAHPNHKLSAADVLRIRDLATEGMAHKAIARAYGISDTQVKHVVRREQWRSVR